MPLAKEATGEYYICFAPKRLKSIGMGKHLIVIKGTTNHSFQVDYKDTLRSIPYYIIPHSSSS